MRASFRHAPIAAALAVLLVPATAGAADQPRLYVTVKDRLMCHTQVELRDGLRAIDAKNKTQLEALDGCHFTIEGVPAIVLQDNISQIKIRISAGRERADMWTIPEAIKPVRPAPED
jgi:hypothetical protein